MGYFARTAVSILLNVANVLNITRGILWALTFCLILTFQALVIGVGDKPLQNSFQFQMWAFSVIAFGATSILFGSISIAGTVEKNEATCILAGVLLLSQTAAELGIDIQLLIWSGQKEYIQILHLDIQKLIVIMTTSIALPLITGILSIVLSFLVKPGREDKEN